MPRAGMDPEPPGVAHTDQLCSTGLNHWMQPESLINRNILGNSVPATIVVRQEDAAVVEPVVREGAAPAVSPWRAVVRVLLSPVETFRALGNRPPVLVPYLVHTLVGVVVLALTYSSTMEMVDQIGVMMASQPGVTGDDVQMMQQFTRWGATAGLAIQSVAGPWIVGFVLALVALFFGQFHGGGVSLSAYMGMIGYARMPLALSLLLSAVYQAFAGQPLNLSAAAFLPGDASPILAAALTMLNPLGLWYYALLAVGFAALFGREPRKGWAMPVTLLVIGTLYLMATASFAQQATLNLNFPQ